MSRATRLTMKSKDGPRTGASTVAQPVLYYSTPDKNGFAPANVAVQIGRTFLHSGNGKSYLVKDFVWNGETDSWNVLMSEAGVVGAINITRPVHQLHGVRQSGEPRYEVRLFEKEQA
jgi:hypothetical protein